jgi:hypothetical protein
MTTMTLPEKGKRGRPKGARRKGVVKWQPKVWRPVYDQIIALHLAGWSNERIADHVEYNRQQVSNILNTDNAKKIIKEEGERIRKSLNDDVLGRVSGILAKTMKRTEQIMDNEDLFKEAPFATIRTGLNVGLTLKQMFQPATVTKETPSTVININQSTQVQQNNLEVVEKHADKLAEALDRAREAKLLNAGTIPIRTITDISRPAENSREAERG